MPHPSPSSTPPFERLNRPERETLALLAQGHTAKSIASATGRSVHSVNERLRDARRKTGVASSRELARLLSQQQSRDDFFEVAPVLEPDPSPRGGRRWPRGMERRIMMALGMGGMLAALLAIQAQAPDASDPRLARVLPPAASDPRALHVRFVSERRDAGWAALAEARLRTGYATIGGLEQVSITCAATVCEVIGTIGVPDASVNAVMQQLQGAALSDGMKPGGLEAESSTFGPDNLFAAYWRKAAA